MAAIAVTLTYAVMKEGFVDDQCGVYAECKYIFFNLRIVLTGIPLYLCARFLLGKLIIFVPKVVSILASATFRPTAPMTAITVTHC